MTDQRIDTFVQTALGEARSTESDADFVARLHQRLEAEGALDPTITRRSLIWRWRWVVGFVGASLCGLIALALWPAAPAVDSAPASFESLRQEVAQLAAENSGRPMVIEINESEGSVLFVSLNESAESSNAIDPALITAEGSITVQTAAPESPQRSSGWIRTRRVSGSTT